MQETDLYQPVKSYLEGQGYEVKAEVNDCDLVAVRAPDPPVIVELKLRLSLALLMQGVNRQAITDAVYIAVPASKTRRWRAQLRDCVKLCRRLGLGLISVHFRPKSTAVEVHCDPGPYRPQKSRLRKTALLREFSRRQGDQNIGGQTRRPVVTAYRQDALRIAEKLAAEGAGRPATLAQSLGIANAASILQKDHYGWFERIRRGVYDLRPTGKEALLIYADVLAGLAAHEPEQA